VAENSVDLAIVRAVIDLASALGISSVAEGVETKDQLAGLRTLGCQVGQGFYFSHPLRAEEFDELLTRQFARNGRPGRREPERAPTP
jgi:diguanylate cyclase